MAIQGKGGFNGIGGSKLSFESHGHQSRKVQSKEDMRAITQLSWGWSM